MQELHLWRVHLTKTDRVVNAEAQHERQHALEVEHKEDQASERKQHIVQEKRQADILAWHRRQTAHQVLATQHDYQVRQRRRNHGWCRRDGRHAGHPRLDRAREFSDVLRDSRLEHVVQQHVDG